MPVGSQFPVVLALGADACVPTAYDDLGRGIEFTCGEVPGTSVTYVGDSERPATVTTTTMLQGGTVEQQERIELQWDDAGRLVGELFRLYFDGAFQGTEFSDAWVYADDGTVAETHARSVLPEPEGPVKGGRYPQPVFSDESVERGHFIAHWDSGGRATQQELRAGLQEIVVRVVEYGWSDNGLSSAIGTILVEESDRTPEGCSRLDPNHIQCTDTLHYDENGVLVSYDTPDSQYAVSDHCCGSCVPR